MSKTLPPLPPHVGEENHGPSQQPVKLYDADQMQAYAIAAIEAQGVPHKIPVPPAQADMLDVVYAEGWNQCCDTFFGGLPAQEPIVITITEKDEKQLELYCYDAACAERDARIAELERQLAECRVGQHADQIRESFERTGAGGHWQYEVDAGDPSVKYAWDIWRAAWNASERAATAPNTEAQGPRSGPAGAQS